MEKTTLFEVATGWSREDPEGRSQKKKRTTNPFLSYCLTSASYFARVNKGGESNNRVAAYGGKPRERKKKKKGESSYGGSHAAAETEWILHSREGPE